MTTPPPSEAKSQAEAMALAFKIRDFLPAHVIEYMSSEEEDAFVASISTALAKLIAENERLKLDVEKLNAVLICANNNTKRRDDQLTATEARLDEMRKELLDDKLVWETEIVSEKLSGNIVKENYARGRLNGILFAFNLLSTLTAEKKEEGK